MAENLEMCDPYRFFTVSCKGSVLNVGNRNKGYAIWESGVVTNRNKRQFEDPMQS